MGGGVAVGSLFAFGAEFCGFVFEDGGAFEFCIAFGEAAQDLGAIR
ncbi:MAG: hypothetical protein ACOY0T_05795 [Myxococcota bacterium]